MKHELSDEERKAVASLKRLAKRWPKSLWLFSGSGGLYVMRYPDEGRGRTPAMTQSGSVDQDFIVASIDGIPNDGGGW